MLRGAIGQEGGGGTAIEGRVGKTISGVRVSLGVLWSDSGMIVVCRGGIRLRLLQGRLLNQWSAPQGASPGKEEYWGRRRGT